MNFFYKILVLFIVFVFPFTQIHSREVDVEKNKIAHRIIDQVSNDLCKKYGFFSSSVTESMDKEEKYRLLGIGFHIHKRVTKQEGEKIIIDAAEMLLKNINSCEAFKPYISNYPFTVKNIDVVLIVYDEKGYSNIFYPDVSVFSLRRGNIKYATEVPENKFDYFTEEFRPYEEVLKEHQNNSD